ncbi:MAG: hypothetical protein ACOC6J_07660 [Spirochaetota bacterium]
MSEHDRTGEQLRSYFRERIDAMADRPAPAPQTPRSSPGSGGRAVWIARLGVAAIFALALLLPFTSAGRASPSARAFTAAHERIGTARIVSDSLMSAHRFMRTYFTGEYR